MDVNDLKPEHLYEYAIATSSYDYYQSQIDMLPSTYLDFARKDAENLVENRARINAVGNAKRAFHLQVEMLCDAFAWSSQKPKRNANFGVLLDYLNKCGVLSPNILRKLNSTRNKVEHDYLVPDEEQVKDYIDVVELFLMATRGFLVSFPGYLDYELLSDQDSDQELALPEPLYITIGIVTGGITLRTNGASRSWEPDDPEYFTWLSTIINHYLL